MSDPARPSGPAPRKRKPVIDEEEKEYDPQEAQLVASGPSSTKRAREANVSSFALC